MKKNTMGTRTNAVKPDKVTHKSTYNCPTRKKIKNQIKIKSTKNSAMCHQYIIYRKIIQSRDQSTPKLFECIFRYIGVFITGSCKFKYILDHAKQSLYRTSNSILGKIEE